VNGRLHTINQSLERVKGKTVFKSPKTTTSRRTITLPALTVDALREHRTAQAAERLALGLGKPEIVFSHSDGSAFDPDSITKAFDRLVRDTGVRRITFHGLRHTHISDQLMDGVHVKIVASALVMPTSAQRYRSTQPSVRICKLMLLRTSTHG
jgi:integrase